MRVIPLALLVVLFTAASACAPRLDPDRGAQRFFDKGREQILSSLEKQNATHAQMLQARHSR